MEINPEFLNKLDQYANSSYKLLNPNPPRFYPEYEQDMKYLLHAMFVAVEVWGRRVYRDPCSEPALLAMATVAEIGEILDLIKKHVRHGHNLDPEKILKENGDALFYPVVSCKVAGILASKTLAAPIGEEVLIGDIISNLVQFSLRFTGGDPAKVLDMNEEKLKVRFPNGFTEEGSHHNGE